MASSTFCFPLILGGQLAVSQVVRDRKMFFGCLVASIIIVNPDHLSCSLSKKRNYGLTPVVHSVFLPFVASVIKLHLLSFRGSSSLLLFKLTFPLGTLCHDSYPYVKVKLGLTLSVFVTFFASRGTFLFLSGYRSTRSVLKPLILLHSLKKKRGSFLFINVDYSVLRAFGLPVELQLGNMEN